MNRFKKFLISKGIEINPECLPMDIKGKFGQVGHIYLDDIHVDSEKAQVTEYYNVITNKYQVLRNGNLEEIYENDDMWF